MTTDATQARAGRPRVYPMLLVAIGVVLAGGGLRLLSLGGFPYYLLAGFTVCGSAVLLWRGRRDPLVPARISRRCADAGGNEHA